LYEKVVCQEDNAMLDAAKIILLRKVFELENVSPYKLALFYKAAQKLIRELSIK